MGLRLKNPIIARAAGLMMNPDEIVKNFATV